MAMATVSGPLKTPKALSGEAEFSQVDVKLQGIELKAAEPLRVGLRNGVATLEQVHITGQDTDMRASGTAQVIWRDGSEGRQAGCEGDRKREHGAAAHVRSGHHFEREGGVHGGGGRPGDESALTGKVQFDKVNIAMDGVPNGLSNMTGTLVFNEDRLQVQSLTATTGGGTAEDWRFDSLPEWDLCGPDGDGRCGAGAAVWIECDGECESEAAGRPGERAVERNDSDDAVWDWAGCGLCGVSGRREA